MIYPKISNSVSKLGFAIATVNLPSVVTCRKNAPCAKGCYALKGNFLYKNVKKSHNNNYKAYIKNPEGYFSVIDATLTQIPYRYFRYHSSGDIVDAKYFRLMCDLAVKHKQTKFLCFTKKYEIINEYLGAGNTIPNNLVIVLSNWKDFKCDNPYNLPTAYVDFGDNKYEFPTNSNRCSGYCGECVNTENSCWDMKKGESVVFTKH
jgi:hypothetical protein